METLKNNFSNKEYRNIRMIDRSEECKMQHEHKNVLLTTRRREDSVRTCVKVSSLQDSFTPSNVQPLVMEGQREGR